MTDIYSLHEARWYCVTIEKSTQGSTTWLKVEAEGHVDYMTMEEFRREILGEKFVPATSYPRSSWIETE